MDEGLVKIIEAVKSEAEVKSEEIINKGNAEAQNLIDSAKKEAESIIGAAKRDAERTHSEVMSQLRLAARDFILQLKEELEELLALSPLRKGVAEAMVDPEFMKKLITAMVIEYGKGEGAAPGGQITIGVPTAIQQELAAELPAMFKDALKGGHALLVGSDRLDGFTFTAGDTGEIMITPEAIVESVKPYVLKKFHSLLEGAGKDAAG